MDDKPHHVGLIVTGVLMVLLAAALACGPRPRTSDTRATVVAVFETITVEALNSPTPAASPTATATPPPPTMTPSPTPPDSRTENGPVAVIPRCASAVQVDGDGADWDAQPGVLSLPLESNTFGSGEWLGPDDLSGRARLCWTESALYLLVEVRDDIHVQTQSGSTAWQGDEVELLFDGDLRGDFYEEVWNGDDTQLGLSPGDFAGLPPAAVQYHPQVVESLDLELAARRPLEAGGDYTLEAAVPWTVLRFVPQPDLGYGLCVALSDNDHVGEAQQDSMVSHCTRLLVSNPTTWATVQLAP